MSALYVQLDITDRDAVARTIEEIKPDAIIHSAAWTDVDGAEEPANKEKVHAIWVLSTSQMQLKLLMRRYCTFTDFVFDGQGERPWEDDKCYAH